MQILVLHPGALGDVILSLPAVSLLRRHFPNARLTFAGNLDVLEAVATSLSDCLRSLSVIPLHRLYSIDPLPESDIRLWRSYDRIVSWTGAGDSGLSRRLAEIGVQARVSPWKPGMGEKRHVARIFIESLYPWIPQTEFTPFVRIEVTQEHREEARTRLMNQGWSPGERLIAVHPGAGSASKRWSTGNFVDLGRRCLRDLNVRLLIAEGPAEAGLGLELARALPPLSTLLAESLPLAQLAAVLSWCTAYVGNDSGISHLAAGLGIPSLVLFGPTSPDLWAPLGDCVTVMKASSMSQITPDRVWNTLQI